MPHCCAHRHTLAQEAQKAGVGQLCPRANALTREGAEGVLALGFTLRAWGVRNLDVGAVPWRAVLRCAVLMQCWCAAVMWYAVLVCGVQAACAANVCGCCGVACRAVL